MKSKIWLERQKRDIFAINARNKGYVSRSAFKLEEINNKFKLISSAKNILELGSSPGGWSQIIVELNKKAKITAFDILDMKYKHSNINFYKEDFMNFDYLKFSNKFDLILSDLAPNTTGHQSTDHLRIISMIENIIFLLDNIALISSSFIFKIWKGSEETSLIKTLKKRYKTISYFKPESSRKESSEIFIVAKNFIQ